MDNYVCISVGVALNKCRVNLTDADITFAPDIGRQSIIDSWPEDIDDTAARHDWAWKPTHTLESAFEQYLVPAIKARYAAH